ncbi:hypothetical protein AB0G73_36110 [Streptomyces sp. NPDC020719]|uniref:hypothetical protein n=1 Tax=Streptomyces sp. NPDC020719 TaxID=3154896 RepID=UPI0033C09676
MSRPSADRHTTRTPALALLNDKRLNGYLRVRLPHDLDGLVDAAVLEYTNSTPQARQALDNAVSPRAAGVLSAYGQRMAAIAVRTQSRTPLRHGLTAVAMAHGHLDDPRDNLFPLAALNHSATLLGDTLHQHITDLAHLLPPRRRRLPARVRPARRAAQVLEVHGAGGHRHRPELPLRVRLTEQNPAPWPVRDPTDPRGRDIEETDPAPGGARNRRPARGRRGRCPLHRP